MESSAHTPGSMKGQKRSTRLVRAASVLLGQRCKWSLKKKKQTTTPSRTGTDHNGFCNFQSFVNPLKDSYFHEFFTGL